jgi:acyl dehydratase
MDRPLNIGLRLPPFERVTDFHNWNRFAAVNDEFVALHMDDHAAQGAGFPSAIGMGNLQLSYVHMFLRAWLGEDGEIQNLDIRFGSPNFRGQTLQVLGRIVAIQEEGPTTMAQVDFSVEDATGTRTSFGVATVTIKGSSQ